MLLKELYIQQPSTINEASLSKLGDIVKHAAAGASKYVEAFQQLFGGNPKLLDMLHNHKEIDTRTAMDALRHSAVGSVRTRIQDLAKGFGLPAENPTAVLKQRGMRIDRDAEIGEYNPEQLGARVYKKLMMANKSIHHINDLIKQLTNEIKSIEDDPGALGMSEQEASTYVSKYLSIINDEFVGNEASISRDPEAASKRIVQQINGHINSIQKLKTKGKAVAPDEMQATTQQPEPEPAAEPDPVDELEAELEAMQEPTPQETERHGVAPTHRGVSASDEPAPAIEPEVEVEPQTPQPPKPAFRQYGLQSRSVAAPKARKKTSVVPQTQTSPIQSRGESPAPPKAKRKPTKVSVADDVLADILGN